MKPFERDEARRLRHEQGLSIKEIAQALRVAKSSVSLWVRDIQLTDEQLAALDYRHNNHANRRNGSRAVAEKYRELRRTYIEDFWLDILHLPRACLRKAITNLHPRSSKQKGRKLKYGVCRVVVHKVCALHHVLGAIQEYTGIDKPEWLL